MNHQRTSWEPVAAQGEPAEILIPEEPVKEHRRPSRFGRWLRFVIITSFVLLAASVSFLSWLWFGCGGLRNPQEIDDFNSWRKVFLGSFGPQAITVTAVVIRYSLFCLASITTAMLASIAVERDGVPVDKIAQVSIVRYRNAGPEALIASIFDRETFTTKMRILIAVQFLCAIAAQFTSTLLLSDLRMSHVRGFDQDLETRYTFEKPLGRRAANPVSDSTTMQLFADPRGSEVFATYEPGPPNPDLLDFRPRSPMIDDTDPIFRAFLPIARQSDRESLVQFFGMTRLFDARTACVRPTITSLAICPGDEANTTVPEFCGSGEIPRDLEVDGLARFNDEDRRFNFSCAIVAPESQIADPSILDGRAISDYWVRCATERSVFLALKSTLDPLYYTSQSFEELDHLSDRLGQSYLFINGSSLSQPAFGKNATLRFTAQEDDGELNGPWANITATLSGEDRTDGVDGDLQVPFFGTYCFDVMMPRCAPLKFARVLAFSEQPMVEPIVKWRPTGGSYSAQNLAAQLLPFRYNKLFGDEAAAEFKLDGLTKTRDTMRLSEGSVSIARKLAESQGTLEYDCRDGNASFVETALQHDGRSKSLVFCTACRGNAQNYVRTGEFVEDMLRDMLQGISYLKSKLKPAPAMTAVNTLVAREAFHRWVDSYDLADSAQIKSFEQALVPQDLKGFTGAILILTVQVALFFVAGSMFRRTRSSLLNNSWQVVAQVAESEDARKVLARATTMTDKEVRQELYSTFRQDSDTSGVSVGPDGDARRGRYVLVDGIFAAVAGKSRKQKEAKVWGLRKRQPKSDTAYSQVKEADEIR